MPKENTQPVEVLVPEMLWEGEGDEEIMLTGWLVANGATVKLGDVIAEIMVDKITMDIEAPTSGRLAINVMPETLVQLGDVIATIYP